MIKSFMILVILFAPIVMEAFSKRYYGHHLCNKQGFSCHKVQRGQTWKELFPNDYHRLSIQKLNRSNISLRHRPYVVIPDRSFQLDYKVLSPMPLYIDTSGEKLVLINLTQQAFAAYNEMGQQVRWGPISGGKSWCSDVGRSCRTIVGSFKVYRKGGPGCKSYKYDNAPMPYCMFFRGGYAMHGSWLPGHHASHGCVRMFIDDALWLNRVFTNIGTKVKIVRGR